MVGSSCDKCGIGYDEMIGSISHDEMKILIRKLEKMMDSHEPIEIEASLLACELKNSSLLVPVDIKDDELSCAAIPGPKGKQFILAFTDKQEYDKCIKYVSPRTNPIDIVLDLLNDEIEGLAINIASDYPCFLGRAFLNPFFLEE